MDSPSVDSPALDLDSAHFDCQAYLKHFLKDRSVKEIIQQNIDLQSEIKSYDLEIQNLVFENYSKFIVSIDTVKQMKSEIGQISKKVVQLDQLQESIQALTNKVNGTLSIKHQEIQRLDTVNKDLIKLRNLCDFPKVLKEDQQAFYQYYDSNTKALTQHHMELNSFFIKSRQEFKKCYQKLKQFQDEPMISPIYQEALYILSQVKQNLWSLMNEQTNFQQTKDITMILVDLSDDNEAVLQNYQIKIKDNVTKRFDSILLKYQEAQSTFLFQDQDSLMNSSIRAGQTIQECMETIQNIQMTVGSKIDNNEGQDRLCLYNLIEQVDQHCFTILEQERQYLINMIDDPQQKKQCDQSILLVREKLMATLIDKTHSLLHRDISSIEISKVALLLNKLKSSIGTQFLQMQAHKLQDRTMISLLVIMADLSDKLLLSQPSLDSLRTSLQTHQHELELAIEQAFLKLLMELSILVQQQDQSMKDHCQQICQNIIMMIINICGLWADKESHQSLLEAGLVRPQTNNTQMHHHNKEYERIAEYINNIRTSTNLFILKDSLLAHLRKSMIENMMGQQEQILGPKQQQSLKYQQYQQSIIMGLSQSRHSNLTHMIQYSVQQLMNFTNYDQPIHITKISQLNVSMGITSVIKHIKQTVSHLVLVFPQNRRTFINKNSFLKQEYDQDMGSLICRKASHMVQCEIGLEQFLVLLFKQYLKHVLRHLKHIDLNYIQYQQVKLDLLALTQYCLDYVKSEDEQLIIGFYYEILRVAQIRCSDQVTIQGDMDQYEKICMAFREQESL